MPLRRRTAAAVCRHGLDSAGLAEPRQDCVSVLWASALAPLSRVRPPPQGNAQLARRLRERRRSPAVTLPAAQSRGGTRPRSCRDSCAGSCPLPLCHCATHSSASTRESISAQHSLDECLRHQRTSLAPLVQSPRRSSIGDAMMVASPVVHLDMPVQRIPLVKQ